MPKYILSTRRLAGAAARSSAGIALQDAYDRLLAPRTKLLGQKSSTGTFGKLRLVIEGESEHVDGQRPKFPDSVLIEPAIDHDPAPLFRMWVTGGGTPLPRAKVFVFATSETSSARFESAANAQGALELDVQEGSRIAMVVVRPFGGFWSYVVTDPEPEITIECATLPSGPIGWWHQTLGVEGLDELGVGIRVGVIDTGVGPHPCLNVTDLGAFLDGRGATFPGTDPDGHGTHVAGLIGGISLSREHFRGAAPAVRLASARAVGASNKAHQGDIANALDDLCDKFDPHLVNVSLTARVKSEILHEAVQDARDRGTLCMCAAGNSGDAVQFPAALPECIAVSAVGKRGWGAPASLATLQQPPRHDVGRNGEAGLFAAVFSCYGSEIFCAAPGVGIISSLPSPEGQALFAEMDGTSMASPLACGALAALLSRDREYRGLPAGADRSERAREILRASCVSVGLDRQYQGHGIPHVPNAHG